MSAPPHGDDGAPQQRLFRLDGDAQDVLFEYLRADLSTETLKELAKLDIDRDGGPWTTLLVPQ